MIINLLICAALCLGTLQTKWWDRYAALFFLTPVVLVNAVGESIPGEFYYFTCAAMDREVLFFLVSSGLFIELACAAFAAIVLSFFGWGLWVAYQPPTCYNLASTLYYIWVLSILLKGSGARAGIKSLLDDYRRPALVHSHDLQMLGKGGATWTE